MHRKVRDSVSVKALRNIGSTRRYQTILHFGIHIHLYTLVFLSELRLWRPSSLKLEAALSSSSFVFALAFCNINWNMTLSVHSQCNNCFASNLKNTNKAQSNRMLSFRRTSLRIDENESRIPKTKRKHKTNLNFFLFNGLSSELPSTYFGVMT